jgi:hypothetical protein
MSCIEVLTSDYIVGRCQSSKEMKMKHADTGRSNRKCNNSVAVMHQVTMVKQVLQ